MTTMTHDGYLATVEIDEDAGIMHGRVINARAMLTFEGETLAELRQAFADTIEDYRDWCKERGVEPERPYSGTLSIRITPELHKRVAELAAKAGESINQFIAERLEEVA
ncbi:type II toxin-antitoxin system HicB family antitoxin [Methylocystis sp. ATCC 49242]|uniref:type II toxin-antitoxin system HicB family antitoxin n=1 Tax=Methylocystis sp. ATCC 49242 TaxID=622637 RepID=UPI0001F86AA9|nr:type II toxin-antitoxin system HicB family antitoxin [Methylocystis sp. ATCC 49242]